MALAAAAAAAAPENDCALVDGLEVAGVTLCRFRPPAAGSACAADLAGLALAFAAEAFALAFAADAGEDDEAIVRAPVEAASAEDIGVPAILCLAASAALPAEAAVFA